MDTRKQTNYNSDRDASNYDYSGYNRDNSESDSRSAYQSSRSQRARHAAQLTRQQRQNANRQAYAQRQNKLRQENAQLRNYGDSSQANSGYQQRQHNFARNEQNASQYSRRATNSHNSYHSRGTQQYNTNYKTRNPRRGSYRRRGWSLKRIIGFLVVIAIVVAVAIFFIKPQEDTSVSNNDASSAASSTSTTTTTTTSSGEDALPTPIMASCDGVDLHSAVSMQSLTEILIHNASYTYAKALTTKLKEATNADIIAAHGTGRVASEQPTGDNWMTGEFIRCYRSESAGPKLSAIDCGGAVGTTVYAPVTGTVVKVKKYNLYDNSDYPDYQVHIQPKGRSDLDVVLIHLTNVKVKKGDHVDGGQTPIAKIRDVYAYIGNSMQLRNYTAKGDNGNHTHIQVNDVTNKKYHGLD